MTITNGKVVNPKGEINGVYLHDRIKYAVTGHWGMTVVIGVEIAPAGKDPKKVIHIPIDVYRDSLK